MGTVIHRRVEMGSDVYARWWQLLAAEGATVYQGEAGLRMALDEGLEMVVLHPGAHYRTFFTTASRNSVVG